MNTHRYTIHLSNSTIMVFSGNYVSWADGVMLISSYEGDNRYFAIVNVISIEAEHII